MSEDVNEFVLLQHVLSDEAHWDLMFDTGEALATWQLLDDPRSSHAAGGAGIRARRIGDHRRAYLDYEGPVSNNRGHVERLDRGGYFLLVRQPELWTVRLSGSILKGTWLLALESGERWTFQLLDR